MNPYHRSTRWTLGLVLLLAAACAGAAPPSPRWTLVDLGTLGGDGSFGAAVSDSGYVAGCANTASGAVHAFLYRAGTMVDLAGDEAGDSCALAVNDSGAAAGRAAGGGLVVWEGGQVTALGVTGDINAINDAGLVVGAYQAGGEQRAFAYQQGVFRDLGTGAGSVANGVNARGEIVGSAHGHAFALLSDGTLRDLGPLADVFSVANAINDRGEIVGMASNPQHNLSAFIYDGTLQWLAGPSLSGAVDINDRGLVVSSGEGVFGYVVAGSDVTRLDKLPDVVAKGWHHMEPTGVNQRGWIVGTGFDPQGQPRAFLLVPR